MTKGNSSLHPLYFSVLPQSGTLTTRAHGLDISKYDQFFEPSVATAQLDFVIQRISYRTTRDEAFDTLLPGVMDVPIRGGYHYLNSDKPWREQADRYLSFVSGLPYHFHACDFEGAFNVLSMDLAYSAWQWIHYVQGRTGKPVLLYTSPSLYKDWIYPSQSRYGINWNTVDLWSAQWFFAPNPDGIPSNPAGRNAGWKFWQYTDKADGTLYGVARPTACDLNVFDGDVNTLRSYLHLTDEPPTQPPTGGTMVVIKGTAIGNVVRRKAPAGDGFSPARYLFVNDAIEADRHEFQWLHLTKINGVPVVGDEWASAGSQQQYIRWEEVDVPVEEPDEPPAEEPGEKIPDYLIAHFQDGTEKRYLPK